ncbi:MAG: hypothetical protein ACJ8GN_23595 [Longimicrobiaceae bacterium]
MKRSKGRKPGRYDPVIAEAERLLAQAAALPPPQITWTPRAPADRAGAREPGAEWVVGIEPWLVDDGEYGVLHVGRPIDFALRWEAIALEAAPAAQPQALALGEGVYQVQATVVRSAEEVCVIDFGLLAHAYDFPGWLREGDAVRGDVALGIDTGSYRRGHYEDLDLPALIYPWRLDRIVLEHATRVPAPEHVRVRWGNPEMMTNDPDLRTHREISVANWEKDYRPGEMGRYHLHCSLLSRIPREPDATDRHPAFAAKADA